MTSIGTLLHDALVTRINTLLAPVEVMYRAEQNAPSNYVLFLDDDERYGPEISDKDNRGNDYAIVLQLWGDKPRTLKTRAKTIIDSVYGTPVTIAGFNFIRVVLEQNQAQPSFRTEGQQNQYARVLRLRFFYHPT